MTGLAAVVLAAGAGTRLRPVTDLLPKALCPVDGVPLVDLARARASRHAEAVAVNVHHGRDAMLAHLDGADVHVSLERERALGTAGALGHLRGWLDGRAAIVANADAYSDDPLDSLVRGWDGERIRLLVSPDPARADFGGAWRFAGASLLPWRDLRGLRAEPAGLYEVCWRAAFAAGRVDLVPTRRAFVDCGRPVDYLAANLVASGGRTVVGPGAEVRGTAVRSLVWAGARVAADERLVDAIRLPDGTTLGAQDQTRSRNTGRVGRPTR